MDLVEARERFTASPVARLATADGVGKPHLVPIVFVVIGDTIYSAVDDKPKQSKALRRLANVAVNPRAAVLVDHYADDWTALWWVRADGVARVVQSTDAEASVALEHLLLRYAQYADAPPSGPFLVVDVERWSGWESAPRKRF